MRRACTSSGWQDILAVLVNCLSVSTSKVNGFSRRHDRNLKQFDFTLIWIPVNPIFERAQLRLKSNSINWFPPFLFFCSLDSNQFQDTYFFKPKSICDSQMWEKVCISHVDWSGSYRLSSLWMMMIAVALSMQLGIHGWPMVITSGPGDTSNLISWRPRAKPTFSLVKAGGKKKIRERAWRDGDVSQKGRDSVSDGKGRSRHCSFDQKRWRPWLKHAH